MTKSFIIKLLVILSVIIIGLFLRHAEAEAPIVLLQDKPIQEIIVYFAEAYGQDADLMLAVAKCESGSSYKADAIGDNGKAYGTFQFHESTFNSYEKKLGEDLNYHSPYDQAKLASFMFSLGEEKQWSCFAKVTK